MSAQEEKGSSEEAATSAVNLRVHGLEVGDLPNVHIALMPVAASASGMRSLDCYRCACIVRTNDSKDVLGSVRSGERADVLQKEKELPAGTESDRDNECE